MELQTVKNNQSKICLALQGLSGSGKSYSALMLAYGLCGDWSQVALIDSEERSGALFSHLGTFTSLSLGAPFHPHRFYEALDLCDLSDKKVIIVDSLSPEWEGEGGVLDRLKGEDYGELLRAHRAVLTAIRHSNAHVICTVRTRQKLVHFKSGSKWRRQLVQLPVQQEGIEYVFDTVLRLDARHKAHVVKDRTGVLGGKAPFRITPETGALLANWCTPKLVPPKPTSIIQPINQAHDGNKSNTAA